MHVRLRIFLIFRKPVCCVGIESLQTELSTKANKIFVVIAELQSLRRSRGFRDGALKAEE